MVAEFDGKVEDKEFGKRKLDNQITPFYSYFSQVIIKIKKNSIIQHSSPV